MLYLELDMKNVLGATTTDSRETKKGGYLSKVKLCYWPGRA